MHKYNFQRASQDKKLHCTSSLPCFKKGISCLSFLRSKILGGRGANLRTNCIVLYSIHCALICQDFSFLAYVFGLPHVMFWSFQSLHRLMHMYFFSANYQIVCFLLFYFVMFVFCVGKKGKTIINKVYEKTNDQKN